MLCIYLLSRVISFKVTLHYCLFKAIFQLAILFGWCYFHTIFCYFRNNGGERVENGAEISFPYYLLLLFILHHYSTIYFLIEFKFYRNSL
jgi:hypothetical protein